MNLMSDICLINEPEWRKWVEIYAKDEGRLKRDFGIIFKAATELGWEKPKQVQFVSKRRGGPGYSLEDIWPNCSKS